MSRLKMSSAIRWFGMALREYKYLSLLTLISGAFVAFVGQAVVPLGIAFILEDISQDDSPSQLRTIATIVIGCMLVGMIAFIAETVLTIRLADKGRSFFIWKISGRINRSQHLESHQQGQNVGAMERFLNGWELMVNALFGNGIYLIVSFISLITVITWRAPMVLNYIAVASLVIISTSYVWQKTLKMRVQRKMVAQNAELNSLNQLSITYCMKWLHEALLSQLATAVSNRQKEAVSYLKVVLWRTVLTRIGIVGTEGGAIGLALFPTLEMGTVYLIVTYIFSLTGSLALLSFLLGNIAEALGQANEMLEKFEGADQKPLSINSSSITVENFLVWTKKGEEICSPPSCHVSGIAALTGKSGGGKTTLLKAIAGRTLNNCTVSGAVKIGGEDVIGRDTSALLALIDQNLPDLNCSLKDLMGGEANNQALEWAAAKDLDLSCPISDMSGGQARRAFTAAAFHALLERNLSILLLDEPTNHLDSPSVDILLKSLHLLSQDHGVTVVVSTHDPRLIDIATTVVNLSTKEVEYR